MTELMLKCWAKGRNSKGQPVFCEVDARHNEGGTSHHNRRAAWTWEPSGCDKGHGPNDRPTAALRLAQLGHELTVEYLARGGGVDGGGSNTILIEMAGRLGDGLTTLEQIERDYENIEASRKSGTGSDRYQEILTLASQVLRPFVSAAKATPPAGCALNISSAKASVDGLRGLLRRADSTDSILREASRAMFETIVGEPMDGGGAASKPPLRPSPPSSPPCTWFFLTKAQQDAITAHTSKGPDGGPNGPLEQAMEDIGAALEAEPPSAFTAKMNGLMAKLCEASANDTQALREAFGLAKDGVTPLARPLDTTYGSALMRAKAVLDSPRFNDLTSTSLATSLLWWVNEHAIKARKLEACQQGWEEAAGAAFDAGATDPAHTLAERIGVLVNQRSEARHHTHALLDAIYDLAKRGGYAGAVPLDGPNAIHFCGAIAADLERIEKYRQDPAAVQARNKGPRWREVAESIKCAAFGDALDLLDDLDRLTSTLIRENRKDREAFHKALEQVRGDVEHAKDETERWKLIADDRLKNAEAAGSSADTAEKKLSALRWLLVRGNEDVAEAAHRLLREHQAASKAATALGSQLDAVRIERDAERDALERALRASGVNVDVGSRMSYALDDLARLYTTAERRRQELADEVQELAARAIARRDALVLLTPRDTIVREALPTSLLAIQQALTLFETEAWRTWSLCRTDIEAQRVMGWAMREWQRVGTEGGVLPPDTLASILRTAGDHLARNERLTSKWEWMLDTELPTPAKRAS